MKNILLIILIIIVNSNTLFSQSVSIVKDINPGTISSNPAYLVEFNNQLYFLAFDSNYYCGLWKSDGTNGGTILVKDFTPGNDTCPGSIFFELAVVNNKLFITTCSQSEGDELWVSDGTASGTIFLKDILPGPSSSTPRYFAPVGNELFFSADDIIHGRELWKSNGTSSGTQLVKDIIAGPANGVGPQELKTYSNNLIFSYSLANGFCNYSSKLWTSDGTSAGTYMIRDIDSVACTSNVTSIKVLDSSIYFRADSAGNNKLLWKSDGTAGGTVLFKNFDDTILNSFSEIEPFLFKDTLYVTTRWSNWLNGIGHLGSKLWKSADGTGAGTSVFFEATHNGLICDLGNFVSTPNYLYFVGYFHSSLMNFQRVYELWRTDGTTTGTALVKSFGDTIMSIIGHINDTIYLSVDDSVINQGWSGFGGELWQCNGTAMNTFKIADIYPGYYGCSPLNFIIAGGIIYFTAADSIHGTELWRLDYNNVSINEIRNNLDFTISPNPASTGFQINYNFQKGDEIILYDVLGKICFTKKILPPTSGFRLQTSDFSNGIYFLEVKTKEGVWNEKVVVER